MHIMSPRTRLHSLQLQLPSSKPIQISVLLFSLSFQPIGFMYIKHSPGQLSLFSFSFNFQPFFWVDIFKLFIYDRLIIYPYALVVFPFFTCGDSWWDSLVDPRNDDEKIWVFDCTAHVPFLSSTEQKKAAIICFWILVLLIFRSFLCHGLFQFLIRVAPSVRDQG